MGKQKEIDKGIAAIEKLKSSLMPESYEALIKLYKKKQKDLNIDIMKSAGGLGDLLGEGGRIGMENGGMPKWLLKILEELKTVKTYTKDQRKIIRDLAYPGVDDFTKAEGGRIGMQSGSTPSDKFLKNWYWDGKGPTGSTDGAYIDIESFDEFRLKHGSAIWDRFGPGKAQGGRIGFQEGTGIMSQTGIPYYADKAVEGIVNSAETLSKLPFAGGELISKLLRQKPNKKMFTEALENITPGSWSENLGISSLAEAEGAKVSDKQRTIGNVLGLGTEIAAPVGGAFKIGQNLISQASKSLGKLKKGKTLEQTIDDTITDFGQSRRDFNILAATSGLMVALSKIGLGGLLKGASKKVDDIRVTYKTGVNEPTNWDDIATWAGNYEFESLTAKGINILRKVFGKDVRTVKDPSGKLTGYVDNVDIGEATSWVDDVKKAGGKMELEHTDDYGNIGKVYESTNKKGIKLTDKEEFLNRSGIDSGYGLYDDSIDEVYDIVHGIGPEDPELLTKVFTDLKLKKGVGGPVGYPPEVYGPPAPKKPIPSPILKPPTDRPDEGPRTKDYFYNRPRWQWGMGFGTKAGPEHIPGTILSEGKSGIRSIEADLDDPRLQLERHNPGQQSKFGINIGKDNVGFQYYRKFDQGGIARRPNAVPPLSGPTPQGLTFLLGDDIVKNRSA